VFRSLHQNKDDDYRTEICLAVLTMGVDHELSEASLLSAGKAAATAIQRADVRYVRSLLNYQKGNVNKGLKHIHRALEMIPTNASYVCALGVYQASGMHA
jgi:hypothetical protein